MGATCKLVEYVREGKHSTSSRADKGPAVQNVLKLAEHISSTAVLICTQFQQCCEVTLTCCGKLGLIMGHHKFSMDLPNCPFVSIIFAMH